MSARITLFLLFLITLLGIFLRITNISPHKLYPDAYQNLLVDENIRTFHSVVGKLGPDGMVFPDFVAWTRSGYPLLINLVDMFVQNDVQAATLVALLAGILAIPAAYLYISTVFHTKRVGILAALLTALSFNHTVWGSFILTETTAILFVLLLLWRLFATLPKTATIADGNDLLVGALLAYGFLTRFEYIVLFLPISMLVLYRTPRPYIRVLTIISSFLFVVAFFIRQLFPLQSGIPIIFAQNKHFLIYGVVALIICSAIIFLAKRINIHVKIRTLFPPILIGLVWLFAIVIVLKVPIHFVGPRNFFMSDPLLGIAALFGITRLLLQKKYLILSTFTLGTLVLLFLIYYEINPLIQRYTTHLFPFLLLPASYGLAGVMRVLRATVQNPVGVVLAIGLLTIFLYQAVTTFRGIKNWDGGTWFRTSYEEQAASKVAERVKDDKTLLLVSFPESYYHKTKLSTHSIADTPPYIYIDDSLNERNVLIVQDMGMRDVFPNFSEVLDEKLQPYKIDEFQTFEIYHFAAYSREETQPIVLYQLPLSELKKRLN